MRIQIKLGDKVKKGDVLVIEESMKMEAPQEAPCDGVVEAIYVNETQEVFAGQLLAAIRPE